MRTRPLFGLLTEDLVGLFEIGHHLLHVDIVLLVTQPAFGVDVHGPSCGLQELRLLEVVGVHAARHTNAKGIRAPEQRRDAGDHEAERRGLPLTSALIEKHLIHDPSEAEEEPGQSVRVVSNGREAVLTDLQNDGELWMRHAEQTELAEIRPRDVELKPVQIRPSRLGQGHELPEELILHMRTVVDEVQRPWMVGEDLPNLPDRRVTVGVETLRKTVQCLVRHKNPDHHLALVCTVRNGESLFHLALVSESGDSDIMPNIRNHVHLPDHECTETGTKGS